MVPAMATPATPKLRSSLQLAGRYLLRVAIVFVATYFLLALSAVCLQSAGYLSSVVILGLGLAALIQGPQIRMGRIVAATFGSALLCAIMAPTISDWRLELLWQADAAFAGAAFGALVSTAGVLGAARSRFSIRHLLELAVAFSLGMAFYLASSDAHARHENWKLAVSRRAEEQAKARELKLANLLQALETAFQASSDEERARFFTNWHDSIQPKPLSEIHDPLERDLYTLYAAFFDPFALDVLVGYESEDDIRLPYEYLVLQDSVDYCIGEVTPEQGHTLIDFRPKVSIEGHEAVFLTPVYREAIETFLNRDMDDRDIQRYKFLQPMMWMFPGHGPFSWELLTPPSISSVVFNADRTEAVVDFYLVAEAGTARMERNGDGWILIDSQRGPMH